MSDIRLFCPRCGCIDLIMPTIVGVDLVCPSCAWTGSEAESLAAMTTEKFYGIEEVGEILLKVGAKHACGPLLSTLQHIGLLNKADPKRSDEYNAAVQRAQDHVMRSILEAIVVASFTAAGEAREKDPVLGTIAEA